MRRSDASSGTIAGAAFVAIFALQAPFPLIVAGALMMAAVRESGATLLPVDSEHNAIFQCLEGRNPAEAQRLILTASGGPFYRHAGNLDAKWENVRAFQASFVQGNQAPGRGGAGAVKQSTVAAMTNTQRDALYKDVAAGKAAVEAAGATGKKVVLATTNEIASAATRSAT